jgi:TonB family protein
MRQSDDIEILKVRYIDRPNEEGTLIRPKRVSTALFQGWGPKLLGAALAIATLGFSGRPAAAAQAVALASCQNHGAALLSNPIPDAPDGDAASGETVLRVDLSAAGRVQTVAVARSSGDTLLDFAAIHVARESRYSAASIDCKPAADQFLYSVTFGS